MITKISSVSIYLVWIALFTYSNEIRKVIALASNNKNIQNLPPSTNNPAGMTNSQPQSPSQPQQEGQIIENYNIKGERNRYRARVAYDGSGFVGFQIQSKGRTIQGELEKVLSQRFNSQVKVVGAGRTDAGVHARGQAFHFDISSDRSLTKEVQSQELQQSLDTTDSDESQFCSCLQTSLNSMLPQDLRVWNISKCPPPETFTKFLPDGKTSIRTYNWHVIYNAKKKLYVYRISMGPQSVSTDPLQRYTRVYVDGDIDSEYLRKILKHYEGTHDFRAFAGAIEANQRKDGIEHKNTVRTVHKVTLIDEGGGDYRIDILLKGALYKMVRNMVGTALDVAKGRVKEELMLQMLHHEHGTEQFVRKDNKCKPAPPEGLTLEKVYFDDDFD